MKLEKLYHAIEKNDILGFNDLKMEVKKKNKGNFGCMNVDYFKFNTDNTMFFEIEKKIYYSNECNMQRAFDKKIEIKSISIK